MERAEKKLNCLKGTARANKPCVGYIEGSVNDASMPKGGRKQVSIIDGKVVFWAVNDFDVTLTSEDITGCTVSAIGVNLRHKIVSTQKNESGSNKKADTYGHVFDLTFADGTSGKLQVIDFYAFGDERHIRPDLNPSIKQVTDNHWKTWNSLLANSSYYPVVAGWLNADGSKDEHYDDLRAPEGYQPDIVELLPKAESSNKLIALSDLKDALTCNSTLSQLCMALDLHNRFEGFDSVKGNNDRVYAIVKKSHVYINEKIRNYVRLEK
jgi:hypothetical protein